MNSKLLPVVSFVLVLVSALGFPAWPYLKPIDPLFLFLMAIVPLAFLGFVIFTSLKKKPGKAKTVLKIQAAYTVVPLAIFVVLMISCVPGEVCFGGRKFPCEIACTSSTQKGLENSNQCTALPLPEECTNQCKWNEKYKFCYYNYFEPVAKCHEECVKSTLYSDTADPDTCTSATLPRECSKTCEWFALNKTCYYPS